MHTLGRVPLGFAVAKVGSFFDTCNFLRDKIKKNVSFMPKFREIFVTLQRERQSESSAVGSVLRSGRRGREFESPLSDMIEDVVSAASSILFTVGWGFAWQASPSGGARSMGRWSTLFCRMERALPDAAVFGAFYGDE